jgi:hypothetical protein
MAYQYKTEELPPRVIASTKKAGTAAPDQVQAFLDAYVTDGWEFHSFVQMQVEEDTGCIAGLLAQYSGGLFGKADNVQNTYVGIFRKEV